MSLQAEQRRPAFCALILATVIAVLDISAVNLALPSIAGDLALSIEQALWLSKANLLACAVAILPCAALGDVVGHRRLLGLGLIVFAMTAAATALGSDVWLLVTLRALQGCAGAAIMCSTLVLLREIFPAEMLGAALGINALFVAVASTAGPALSGVMLSFLSWRWLFALSPPLALVAWVIGRAYLPQRQSPGGRFDLPGTCLLTGSATAWLMWHLNPRLTCLAGLAVLLTVLFVLHQRQAKWPILPFQVFSNLRFDYALATSVIAFIGQSGVYIALPLEFQQNMAFSPLAAAALFIPWPLMTALVGPYAGKYADRVNPRLVASLGIGVFAAGLMALALLPQQPLPLDIMWRTALCGVGFGLFQSPNNREILTNILPQHAARGAALLCTARLLGQALGAVVVGMTYLQSSARPTARGISELLWSSSALQVGSLALGGLGLVLRRYYGRRSVVTSAGR